ncbi:MAG: phytanoyl-CoA dioxygenase family protein, partial [Flavobacteriaceae bacterium]
MQSSILDHSYLLSKSQLDFYKENAYIKLKEVLDPATLAHYNRVISKKVNELNQQKLPLKQRDTYGKAFLQLFNLWREDPEIKKLVFSKRLAQIATALMGVKGVRLYHDQALFKEAGGGVTPWHADQYYWPLASSNTVTAWIPLQKTPREMGPLEFSAGSHKLAKGRDLSISDESEYTIEQNLRIN